MKKRLLALTLSLLCLLGAATPAQASVATLDQALSRWLDVQTDIRFASTMQVETLLPFDDTTLALFNGVLKHVTANTALHQDGDESSARFSLEVDGTSVMDATQTRQSGAYSLETSLLPNRTLTSATMAPMDLLAAATDAQSVQAPAAGASDGATTAENDASQAFDLLAAVEELQGCYQTLTDGIQPFATEKRANYNIKGIGAGKWSRIARLTTEQSDGLLDALRAVLSSGMDAAYREELSQVTFGAGFIVALYQNAEKQDLCVYMKGNLLYPDGGKRKLVWQWAFTNNGLKRKDTFKYEASVLSGAADSRLINASATQEGRSDLFSINGKTETTLKRNKIVQQSTAKVDLSGAASDVSTLTCKGSISQELKRTEGGETAASLESAAVDLAFAPDEAGSVLSGTIHLLRSADKTTQTAWLLTLSAPGAQLETVAAATPTQQPDEMAVTVTTDSGRSSIEDVVDETPEPTASAQPDASGYLVGSAPAGLVAYKAPQNPTTVALDQADGTQRTALLTEAAQNLAGRLLPALAALPEEDNGLLRDGMTDADFAAFLALLNAL